MVDAMTDLPLPLRLVVLHRGEPPLLVRVPRVGIGGSRIGGLARAIAASDGWSRSWPATLVVRAGKEPALAAVGRFDEAAESWLAAASRQLVTTLQHLALLDHAAAEAAAERLADALSTHHGRSELRRFRYAAVPRGGLLVLGMLAYLLDLPSDRLTTTSSELRDDDTPLVLVDDIAISGLRLSQTLAGMPERPTTIATLHAHPDLRAAFVAMHPRVEAFVSAHDLHDHAPAALADGYPAWLERWRGRAAPGTAWIGQPDHVVYPWNEPDLGVWNEVSGREEPGWSVVPPERCLKRRGRVAVPVQVMPAAAGPLGPHPDVVTAEAEGGVVVGHLGSGASFLLEGSAADIWRALVATGERAAAAARVGRVYQVAPADLVADVEAFTADLLGAGLLIEEPA
jgi:hypothetical protein